MKLRIAIITLLFLSCSDSTPGEHDLSYTGFYSPPDTIIETFAGEKPGYRKRFILADALKKKGRYLEAVPYYVNSCYREPVLTHKLRSFNDRVSDIFRQQEGETEYCNDAIYETGRIYFKYRKYREAIDILTTGKPERSGLGFDILLLKAKALTKEGLPGKALSLLKRGLESYTDKNAETFLRIRIASLLELKEKWTGAFHEYLKVIRRDSGSWQAKTASARIGKILKEKKIKLDRSKDFPNTAKALYLNGEYTLSLGIIKKIPPAEKTKEILFLTVKNLCRLKGTGLRTLLRAYGNKPKLLAEIKKSAADEYGRMKNRRESMKLYRDVISSAIEPFRKAAAKKIAEYYSRSEKTLRSPYIMDFTRDYPGDPLSGKLLWLQGRSHLKNLQYEKAANSMEKSLAISPEGSYSDGCRFWLYKIYMRMKNQKKALPMLNDLVRFNPASSYTVILLRRITDDGLSDEIKKLLTGKENDIPKDKQLLWHALLSLKDPDMGKRDKRLKQMGRYPSKKFRSLSNKILPPEQGSGIGKNFIKIEEYFRIGYTAGIKREVNRLINENVKRENLYVALAKLGKKYGNAYYSSYYTLLLLNRLKIDIDPFTLPSPLLRLIYPIPFNRCLTGISKKSRVDRNLLISIIRAESFYRHDAVSRSGAVGLMQLLPSTGKNIAKKLKKRKYSLYHPCTSIEFGSVYINWLKKNLGNGRIKVLAAYNAGIGNVRKWRTWKKMSSDPDFLIEFIPFYETRGYVLMINKFVEHYRLIYR